MGKKLALFILGLALVFGIFVVYQHLTGTDGFTAKPKVRVTTAPTTLPMYWEQRDENGVLQYVVTAAKSPELLRDANGNPQPGQFKVEKPLATFYDRSGRVIQISADVCRITVDQGPKGSGDLSGKGGKGGTTLTVREGELEGHVRMTVTAKPGSTATTSGNDKPSADPLAGGFCIYFADVLHLDGPQEILTTNGAVQVRSDRFAFDGQGMQLNFNFKEKRLDYLNIEKGEKAVIRHVGAKALAMTEPTERSTATTPPTDSGKTPTLPVTYRLTFGQNVQATVGESTLSGDRFHVLFMAARELLGETRPASRRADTVPAAPVVVAGGVAAVPPPLLIPNDPDPIAPAQADDLAITWSGPLEIRPADATDPKLAGPRDVILEALGTAGKPVIVSDPRFNAQSGRLWIHRDEQRLVLEPKDFRKVLLKDPGRGSVECASVAIDFQTNHAQLTGPGTLLADNTDGKGGAGTAVTWKTRLDLDLVAVADAKDPSKKSPAIRRAVMDGVTVKAPTFELQADSLDALIANVTDKGKQVPALERLLASGNVLVHTFRKGATAADEQGGLQTQQMEILTAVPAGSAVPVPAQLTAQGNVRAWRYTEKGLGAGAAGTTAVAATNTGAAARQKESITAPKLVATLVPKAKSAADPASDFGFGGTGQNFDVTRFVASDGARVEIVPPSDSKNGTIVATAGTIDGQPQTGTATLTAAGADPVRVAVGENSIEARSIFLEQNPEKTVRMFKVATAGTFRFVLPPDKTRKTATPMLVTWQESMTYDDLKHLAVFTGKPVARVLPAPGAPDQSDQARLQCDKTLTVQLRLAGAAAVSAPAVIAGSNLDLDWMQADGNVEAYGAQIGPDNKLLTSLLLKAPDSPTKLGTLRYNKDDNAFVVDGPGTLAIENYRPDKPDAKVSAAGESGFRWKGSLKYDGKANTITFAREVEFVFLPTKHFNFSGALSGAASASQPGQRPPDILQLKGADQLVCVLAPSSDTSGKTIDGPIGFGAGGNQEVKRVDATGRPLCTVGTYRLENGAPAISPAYLISGDTMSFDVPANLATITGQAGNPAVIQIQRVPSVIFTGRRLKLDLTKDKKFFEGEDWQGNLSNFGG
jgi:hypothetical protein